MERLTQRLQVARKALDTLAIFERLPAYAQLMDRWLSIMEKRQIENIDQEDDES